MLDQKNMKTDKFGLLTYPATPYYNVGDYIQSLAAKQYIPSVDVFVKREKLKSYDGISVNMIMNSWYMYNTEEFPPSPKINPLFVSFHLNANVKDKILGSMATVEYLKKHGPIGCRDLYTHQSLQSAGIPSFFSGCLTTTLDIKYKWDGIRKGIILADPMVNLPNKDTIKYSLKHFLKAVLTRNILKLGERKNLLNKLVSKDILDDAEWLHHKLSGKHSEEKRFQEAERFLSKFAKAELVITSRIHCALPCLALGTPVIFINYGFFNKSDQSRFEGIMDLFNTLNIDKKGNIRANFDFDPDKKITLNTIKSNPDRHVQYAEELKKTCKAFVNKQISA